MSIKHERCYKGKERRLNHAFIDYVKLSVSAVKTERQMFFYLILVVCRINCTFASVQVRKSNIC